jgi:hypothetical protein
LEVPEGFTRSKMRCAECGVFTNLPKETRRGKAAEPPASEEMERKKKQARPAPKDEDRDEDDRDVIPMKAEAPPPKPAASQKAQPDAEPERDVLIQGTEDDDGNPYQVTGDVVSKRCPECNKKIEKADRICVHCGYNYDNKQKKERTFQPITEQWEAGYPYQTRFAIFIGVQVVNFVILAVCLFTDHGGTTLFMLGLITVALQAFLIGTYQRLNLTRSQKGKIVLTTTWRYAFFAKPTETVKWKEHDSVGIKREGEFDVISWAFVLILLAYGIVPGVAFWYFMVRPDKFTVKLCADHGSTETPIFRTTNEELAKEVQQVVSEVTTLPFQK